ncbi:MAG TPA: triose-phosphate isomerase [Oscillatoriaceae cyanobacterium]
MSTKRKPVIAGNWKMHTTLGTASALAEGVRDRIGAPDVEVVICPPFTALSTVGQVVANSPVRLGAQNMNAHAKGAFTGEIAPDMLTDLGVTYVILGHSERRQLFGETDELVNAKVHAAIANGLVPIICVGETLEEREAAITDTVVIGQTQRALIGVAPERFAALIFAYEPVWAIGTGKTCDASEANRVCALIRDTLAKLSSYEAAEQARVLYGGSVKPETIRAQMAESDIDGALVGGASLEAASFAAIVAFDRTAT